jgi:hypothetical protein
MQCRIEDGEKADAKMIILLIKFPVLEEFFKRSVL